MTRTPFDQCKLYLDSLFAPRGEVDISEEVPGESLWVDVFFKPAQPAVVQTGSLTMLDRVALTPCLFEPFRNPPSPAEIRKCLQKLYWMHGEYERAAKRENRSPNDAELPQLWIFSPSASKPLLRQLAYKANRKTWGPGIYCSGSLLKVVFVAINQLPVTPETLWIRLMGRGQTQKQAIAELIALPEASEFRSQTLRLLTQWKITIETSSLQTEDEQELAMNFSDAFLQWEQKTEQRGIQTGIQQGKQEERSMIVENLLKARFGAVDEALAAVVPPLASLPPEDYAQWVLQLSGLSREALLAQFGDSDAGADVE